MASRKTRSPSSGTASADFCHCGIRRYVTSADPAAIVDEQDFVVHDAKTGDDITRSVLMRIIREQANHG